MGRALFLVVCAMATSMMLAACDLANPPKFSNADPTGCYFVENTPIFQLKDGRLLTPLGKESGVNYHIEPSPVGNSIVTDHQILLTRAATGLVLEAGPPQNRYNSLVDSNGTQSMLMEVAGTDRPGLAERKTHC